jgi:hypothetical protein
MKLSSLALVAVLAFSVVIGVKPAKANQQLVASICDYVATDQKSRLRKKLKESRVKLRNIYNGIACNGKSLIRFAVEKNSVDIGVFIIKKIPASKLSKFGDVAWAESNGHADSAIIAKLKERIGS